MPTQAPTTTAVLQWHPQPIPVLPVLGAVALVLYAAGVLVLHRRGDRWSAIRSVLWLLGIGTFLLATATGIDGYGMELFSVHMLQHMILAMLCPVLLVLGAPITLLLRALPSGPGRRGRARRLVLRVLHSRPAVVLTNPLVTFVLFLMSLYGLYFTPVFDWLMSSWWGHNLMLVHFVLIGFLYFWGVLDVDPGPRRHGRLPISRQALSLLELGATAPFHAFFGVVVMMSTTLLVTFYAQPAAGLHTDPLADQAVGGGIAWSFTEIPTLIVLGALVLAWERSDARRTARAERRAERDGEPDLLAYNRYLKALAGRDGELR